MRDDPARLHRLQGKQHQVNPISPERRERFTQMQGFLPPSVQAMLVDPSEPNVAP